MISDTQVVLMEQRGKGRYAHARGLDHSVFTGHAAVPGVLLTCPDSKEKLAVRDAYRVLNDAFAHEFPAAESAEESRLDAQARAALGGAAREGPAFRFQQVKVRARGVLFIMFNAVELQDPSVSKRFVNSIVDEALQTDKRLSRFLFKFVPVERAFRAGLKSFEQNLAEMVAGLTAADGVTWSLGFKCRNNSEINRVDFFAACHRLLPPSFEYTAKEAELVVFVDVAQTLMCLSFLDGFEDRNSYSLNIGAEEPRENRPFLHVPIAASASVPTPASVLIATSIPKTIYEESPLLEKPKPQEPSVAERTNKDDIDLF